MVADLTPALPFAKSGRLRLIATVSSRRAGIAPDLPTMAESGIKMPPVDGRQGLVAPAGTPREIIRRLHAALVTVLKNPDVKQRFAQMGFDIVGDTPEQFSAGLKADGETFAKIIRQAQIEAD
jgi:tripartite-type tricarboxylate transporter receptor subunit TctC